jgi:flagellar basal-body rod modification protein FlgD
MDTTPVSSTAASAVSTASAAQDAQKKLSANFDTFLTLLTTQLKNQDPLSPMDSNQFTQQLVEFSQVEQQINSNQNLESLIALTKARSATDAVSYLGKSLTLTDGTAALMNSEAKWAYSLDSDSASTRLVVTDAHGKAVYSSAGETTSGMHAFSWNGQDNSGNSLPPGVYTLKVVSQAADGSTVGTRVASQGTITEVDLTGSEPLLMIGPMGVPLSKATLVSAN